MGELDSSEWELVLKGLQARHDHLTEKGTRIMARMQTSRSGRDRLIVEYQANGQEIKANDDLKLKVNLIIAKGAT